LRFFFLSFKTWNCYIDSQECLSAQGVPGVVSIVGNAGSEAFFVTGFWIVAGFSEFGSVPRRECEASTLHLAVKVGAVF